MRKFITLIFLTFILAGCNLPVQSTSVPTVDVLATQVTVKLTAAPTFVKTAASTAIATQAVTAKTPTVSATASLATSTLAPSATVLSPTVASSSATLTPTATTIPGDPRGTLGKETFRDTFQKPSIWGLDSPYDDGHTRVSISSGKLTMTSLEGNNWHGWRMYNAKLQNFYLEVTITTHDCSGSDQYGLIFRSPGDKGYWFIVTCDGTYSLESGDILNSVEIIKAKASSTLKAGSNQTNRLGVMANGTKIGLYANGKLLEEVTNDAYKDAGIFGYFIAGVKTANFTYDSSEVIYWKLP